MNKKVYKPLIKIVLKELLAKKSNPMSKRYVSMNHLSLKFVCKIDVNKKLNSSLQHTREVWLNCFWTKLKTKVFRVVAKTKTKKNGINGKRYMLLEHFCGDITKTIPS